MIHSAIRTLAHFTILTAVLSSIVGCVDGTAASRLKDAGPASGESVSRDSVPQFTSEGALIRPRDWETWVMVGASIGLTYQDVGLPANTVSGMFHNVFVQPWAYRHFLDTGSFAEGTMFVLTFYQPSRSADPARGGFYQGAQAPTVEVHVKREGVHPSGWGFYNFRGNASSADLLNAEAACYSCHADEGGHDNVFVQFYPRLRERLTDHEVP